MDKIIDPRRILACLALVLGLGAVPAYALAPHECTDADLRPTTPSSDFLILQGDEGVAHHVPTGLQWRRCPLGQEWNNSSERCSGRAERLDWQDSLVAARDLGDKWRLPSINELRSIVELCVSDPMINEQVFHDIEDVFSDHRNARVWTSSPMITSDSGDNHIRYVDFEGGREGYEISGASRKSDRHFVLLVRNVN